MMMWSSALTISKGSSQLLRPLTPMAARSCSTSWKRPSLSTSIVACNVMCSLGSKSPRAAPTPYSCCPMFQDQGRSLQLGAVLYRAARAQRLTACELRGWQLASRDLTPKRSAQTLPSRVRPPNRLAACAPAAIMRAAPSPAQHHPPARRREQPRAELARRANRGWTRLQASCCCDHPARLGEWSS